MKLFAPPGKKLLELLFMCIFAAVFYFLYPSFDGVILFIFGFVWNWSASIELDPVYESRRYRFSMLSTVRNAQSLFLKPFNNTPEIIKSVVKVLPAGTFWVMVILINDSDMPWWAPFTGSAAFELIQFNKMILQRRKGNA